MNKLLADIENDLLRRREVSEATDSEMKKVFGAKNWYFEFEGIESFNKKLLKMLGRNEGGNFILEMSKDGRLSARISVAAEEGASEDELDRLVSRISGVFKKANVSHDGEGSGIVYVEMGYGTRPAQGLPPSWTESLND